MAGRGRVEKDQVDLARSFELLDLAEHEDVLDARRRGGDDVERAAPHEAVREPAHPVVVEVLEQGVVGRERPGQDRARAALARRSAVVSS